MSARTCIIITAVILAALVLIGLSERDQSSQSSPTIAPANQPNAGLRDIEQQLASQGNLAQVIRRLKRQWQTEIPVQDILAEIGSSARLPGYRGILIDGLGSVKRRLSADERLAFQALLEALIVDSNEAPGLRAMAARRYAALWRLMQETGELQQTQPDSLYAAMQDAETGSPLQQALLTCLATIGDQRIATNLEEQLTEPGKLSNAALRTATGAAGILRLEAAKAKLIEALQVAPAANSYAATAYALHQMFDFEVLQAFNRPCDYLEGRLLVDHLLASHKGKIQQGLDHVDEAISRESLRAVLRVNDEALTRKAVACYQAWPAAKQQAVLASLKLNDSIGGQRFRMLLAASQGDI